MRSSRRIAILLVFLALVAAPRCSNDDDPVTGTRIVTGSGVVAEEDRTVAGFSAVSFATEGSLHIVRGAQGALRVRAEDNLLQYLDSEVLGGTLVLSTTNGVDITPTLPIEFFVTVVDVDSLVLSGVGDIDYLGIDTVDMTVLLSGVADVVLAGSVDTQVVNLSGIGDYDAENLVSREARLTMNSLGTATVRVSELLVIHFTNGGTVDYIGSPQLQLTGNGIVRKIG